MSKFTNEQVAQIAQIVAATLAQGEFSTPTAVATATKPKARKSTKKASAKAPKAVKAVKSTEAPAEVREMFAGLAATREPMKPLNKALASVLREQGRPWVKATEADAVTLKAAYAQLTKAEASAARKALSSRKAAKKA